MFEKTKPAFMLIPGESKNRILHPSTVTDLAQGKVSCVFEETSLKVKDGDEVVLYAEVRGKFMQIGAKVDSITDVEGKLVFNFATVGAPVSAESRGSFRVSIVTDNIYATLGKFSSCPVADISAEGFAVLLKESLAVGSTFEATILSGETELTGMVRIQTVKQLPTGQFRYGLLAYEAKSPFRKNLQNLAMELQRTRLKRLSRAA